MSPPPDPAAERKAAPARVVILSDFAHVNGGAAHVAIESARGLAERGVEVLFAHASREVSARLDHPRITRRSLAALEVWQVASRVAAARQGIWNGEAEAFVSAILGECPPGTVVHLHQWTKALSPAAIGAAAASGLPVVVTLHDYFAFCPTGGYYDFKERAPCTRRPLGPACIMANCDRTSYAHKLVRLARQWRTASALAACANLTFVHVSESARAVALPHLPAGSRHATVPNMMVAAKGPPAEVARNTAVVHVGRLTPEKGVVELAEAARLAAVPVRFVGDGPMADAVLRANPEAVVTGWLPEAAVVEEIRGARAVAAPSLWLETGPMTVAEARAQGVPAIVSRGIGAAALVEDGVDGLLFEPGRPESLVAALRRMSDPDEAARMGQAAYRAWWAAPFDLDRHVSTLLEVYAEALTGHLPVRQLDKPARSA